MTRHSRRSSKGMMLVEDPRETIKAACEFYGRTVDLQRYKSTYEEIIGRYTKPIHIKHAHTHFYSLTSFNILSPVESGKGLYTLSHLGKQLCENLQKSDINEYKKILRYILLNNPNKGNLFQNFLEFISECSHRSRKELYEKFKEIPARALISWSIEAGLIDNLKDKFWIIEIPSEKDIDLDKFWNILNSYYNELTSSEIFGIDKVFVDIRDLTSKFCIKYNWSIDEFDEYLRKLLDSEYEAQIRLYGAPTSYFANKKNFMYNNRVYAFLRIMVS
ncbi:MAG: hypothetical protein HWN66_16805 [Candidatus Helarchaeota archaeon]|nr:hypothetical protein [Candidatus Helarchaeota archaeon]